MLGHSLLRIVNRVWPKPHLPPRPESVSLVKLELHALQKKRLRMVIGYRGQGMGTILVFAFSAPGAR